MKIKLICVLAMVLFFCSFQAVKAQSARQPIPEQKITSSKIDFNLIKCIGNKKDQSVEVILTLINHDANQDFQFEVAKAIDIDGTGYKTYEIKIGSGDIRNTIYTDVPVKTIIRFKEVLPTVKTFRLIPISFYYGEPGHTKMIEYKNIEIDWH